jgi:hypothetical protein
LHDVQPVFNSSCGPEIWSHPFSKTCYSSEGYFPTWPKKTAPSPTLMKFLGWIREQLQLEDQQTEDTSGSVSNIQ